jgi:hypothetical protein
MPAPEYSSRVRAGGKSRFSLNLSQQRRSFKSLYAANNGTDSTQKYSYNSVMPSRIWGPLIVIGIFALAGGMIGADIALWPWDEPVSLPIPITVGLIAGFIAGVFIVWVVRQVEELR